MSKPNFCRTNVKKLAIKIVDGYIDSGTISIGLRRVTIRSMFENLKDENLFYREWSREYGSD